METKIKTAAFKTMQEAAATLENHAVQAWKEQGGKVVGYFCSMLPQELFIAAGLLPFRMRGTGSTSTDLADAYFTNLNCSFTRHCLNLGLDGSFDFLDGLVCINSCDQVRRIYDTWRPHVATEFIEFVTLPHQSGADQVAWYTDEFTALRGKLEGQFKKVMTDEDLHKAIALCNETRSLQKRLYELRKQDNPPITGAEALVVMVAGTAMPPEQYNALLRELLGELEGTSGPGGHRARLMIAGGVLDDPAYIEAIEGMGGLVVTDSTCFGTRLMWENVDTEVPNPLEALARYYLVDRPSCPRLYDAQEKRTRLIQDLYAEFNCDGIIGERMMFCDQWNVEHYMLDTDLKEAGIPFLKLEREYLTSGTGQLRTRVQAFIETMGK